MKILIYSPKFFPSVGGLENLTLMLARQFLAKGNQVKVISSEMPGEEKIDVDVYYNPSVLLQVKLFKWADILYMPNLSLKGLWLLILNPFKKWVVSHNGWYADFSNPARVNETIKLFLIKFSKNISVSQSVSEYIKTSSIVIPNCYDNITFQVSQLPEERKIDFLFVGRLVSDKGIDTLLQAFLKVHQANPDIQLSIVGDGEMKEMAISFIEENNLHNSISLKGKLVGKDLGSEFNRHKILVVPSKWPEPFGIVALEGLACGCKVICSSEGGLPEAVGEFGVLFKNGSVDELAIAMENILNNPPVYDEKRLNIFLEDHNPEKVAVEYLKVFEKR